MPTPQGDQTPAPKVVSAADVAKEEAPAPSKGASKKYRVKYPTTNFVVEGLPVIDKHGVALTAEQHKKADELAKKCGVKLVEVND